MADPKKIVVIGAGMAGLAIAQALRKRRDATVTLVSEKEHFVFLPRLTEYFGQSIPTERVVLPLSELWLGERVRERATIINPQERTIVLASGATLPYDVVVVATGSTTNFFGTQGSQYSFPFYAKEDADKLREHVERLLSADEQPGTWTFAVVGGGPTGVEVAYVLNKLVKSKQAKGRVLLVERVPTLLRMLPPNLAEAATHALAESGVEIMTNTGVANITPLSLEIQKADGSKETIPCYTTVWAAGSKPQDMHVTGIDNSQRGEVPVDACLCVQHGSGVFCAGDLAGAGVPKTAQAALQEAEHLIATINAHLDGKPLPQFKLKEKGTIIALDERTVGLVFGRLLKGFVVRTIRDQYYRSVLGKYRA